MFWLLIPCQVCFRTGCVEQRKRQNTNYADDELNWQVYACHECSKEIDAYWSERWAEYWSMVL